MNENEEVEQTDEEFDAELEKELTALDEEADEEPEAEKEEETPLEQATDQELTDEQADEIIRVELAKRPALAAKFGMRLPGQEEAEQEGAKEEARSQTVDEVVASLGNPDLDPAVLDAIEKRFPGEEDRGKRDTLFVRYAVKEAIRQQSQQVAQEAVTPIQEQIAEAQFAGKIRTFAAKVSEAQQVPEAAEKIEAFLAQKGRAKIEEWLADPDKKQLLDYEVSRIVHETSVALDKQDERPLPTSEQAGGGRGKVAVPGTLTGEMKAMVDGMRADGYSQKEIDDFIKQNSGAKV